MGPQTSTGKGGIPKQLGRTWRGRRRGGKVEVGWDQHPRGGAGRGGVPTWEGDQGVRGERGRRLPRPLGPWRACRGPGPTPQPSRAPPAVLGLSPAPQASSSPFFLFSAVVVLFCLVVVVLFLILQYFYFSNFILVFILSYCPALPFFFFFSAVWLVGSRFRGRGSGLSSCGRSTKSKPLD